MGSNAKHISDLYLISKEQVAKEQAAKAAKKAAAEKILADKKANEAAVQAYKELYKDFTGIPVYPEKYFTKNAGKLSICNAVSPDGKWGCSLYKGHDGPHEGYISAAKTCCPPWPNEKEIIGSAAAPPALLTPVPFVATTKKLAPQHKIWDPTQGGVACFAINPHDGYSCSRPKGHTGPHEAMWGPTHACSLPWEDETTVPAVKPVSYDIETLDTEESPF